MPPIVTSLPWLSNQPDPVQSYQRSQALVQQMQAQQAQERQQQAALAQRAQEAAMQAQFQQRALALKEEEARSSVKLEADRLRHKQQGLEFETQMAERQFEELNQPPQAVNIPGMPPAIQYRGRIAFPPRTPDTSGVGQSVPVYEDNDPGKRRLGFVSLTSERGGAFVPEPKVDTTSEKAQSVMEREARATDKSLLMQERKELSSIINSPGRMDELDPASKADVLQRFSDIQQQLRTYRTAPTKAAPESSGVRIRRKSDGKVLRYKGNRADVPTSEFDIVE